MINTGILLNTIQEPIKNPAEHISHSALTKIEDRADGKEIFTFLNHQFNCREINFLQFVNLFQTCVFL